MLFFWLSAICGFISAILAFVLLRRHRREKRKQGYRRRISIAEMVRANELRAQRDEAHRREMEQIEQGQQ